jgi:DNA-nicking Smr family endonuclease
VPHRLPVDGVLDLHAFHPSDASDLVADYLDACAEAGLRDVRIVHGKGTGALRRTVEAVLRRHPLVLSFRIAGEDAGGWGATLVSLRSRAQG